VSPLLPRSGRGKSGRPALPVPDHPYRDTAILHGTLGAILFAVASLTGTGLAKSALVALAYFVAATAWSWWRFSARIRAARAADAGAVGTTPPQDGESPS
jgi:hypothetical protein